MYLGNTFKRFPKGVDLPPRDPREISRSEGDVFPNVPDICQGNVSRNTVLRAVFPSTLPRDEGVHWKIWSLEISFIIAPVPVNTKKYIPTVR